LSGGCGRSRGIELGVVEVCDDVSGWEGTGCVVGVIGGCVV